MFFSSGWRWRLNVSQGLLSRLGGARAGGGPGGRRAGGGPGGGWGSGGPLGGGLFGGVVMGLATG